MPKGSLWKFVKILSHEKLSYTTFTSFMDSLNCLGSSLENHVLLNNPISSLMDGSHPKHHIWNVKNNKMKAPIAPDAFDYLHQMSVLPFFNNTPRICFISLTTQIGSYPKSSSLLPFLFSFLTDLIAKSICKWRIDVCLRTKAPSEHSPSPPLSNSRCSGHCQLTDVSVGWIRKQEQKKDTPFNLFVWGISWVFHWYLTPRHKAHFSLKLQDFPFAQFQMV